MHRNYIASIVFCFFVLLGCSSKKPDNQKFFQGIVIKGKQEARQLHIPTANITVALGNVQEGVYSCKVFIKKTKYNAMCYYDISRSNILEAHIFDFNKDLYNQEISIYLKSFIRKPVKNISFEQIKLLIEQDIKSCRKDFN